MNYKPRIILFNDNAVGITIGTNMTSKRTLLGHAPSVHIDDTILTKIRGLSVYQEYAINHRLIHYYIDRFGHVPFAQRSILYEATRYMVESLSLSERQSLDQQLFPEYYL